MKLYINSIFKQQQGQREEREEKDLGRLLLDLCVSISRFIENGDENL
jgi:hypothetical protein